MSGSQDKALGLFEKAFENVVPYVEVRSRRVGGSVYQIPREVNPKRRQALGLRWIIQAAQARPNKTMGQRLASELLEAIDSKGGAVRKKVDVQRMAEANRAFSHYAW
jgi:small subunit ribosomal protein S7